ncbi:PEP-utilizing enzyme [Bacillus velezensis]|nr:PEP-utilizing enzyme [Bacillus velezensis]
MLRKTGILCGGEILVTSTTNVGWTPLFPRAVAIITDVGAPLSHAAIVAGNWEFLPLSGAEMQRQN